MRKEKKKEEEGEEKVKLGIYEEYFIEEEWGSNQRKEERSETGWRGRVERKERETTLFQQNNVSDIKQTHGKMAQRGVCVWLAAE